HAARGQRGRYRRGRRCRSRRVLLVLGAHVIARLGPRRRWRLVVRRPVGLRGTGLRARRLGQVGGRGGRRRRGRRVRVRGGGRGRRRGRCVGGRVGRSGDVRGGRTQGSGHRVDRVGDGADRSADRTAELVDTGGHHVVDGVGDPADETPRRLRLRGRRVTGRLVRDGCGVGAAGAEGVGHRAGQSADEPGLFGGSRSVATTTAVPAATAVTSLRRSIGH